MNRIFHAFVLLLLLLPATLLAAQYDGVYVFGDSLSDNGNLASVIGPFPEPPYYQNRVSNGLLAVEVMAARLGLPMEPSLHLIGPAQGGNYAVAGARAARNEPQDLGMQVTLFLANHGGVAPADALYVMFLGGNDIRSARDSVDPVAAQALLNDAAQAITGQMRLLAQAGARHWLLVNAPDIGRIPETSLLAGALGLPQLVTAAHDLSLYFNRQLKMGLHGLRKDTDSDVAVFDLYKRFGKILDKAGKLGFSNSTEPCFSSVQGAYTAGCNFGLNIDQYVFFDEIHPTARVHAMIGDMMYRKVSEGVEAE